MTDASSIINRRAIDGNGFSFHYIEFDGWPIMAVQFTDELRV